MISQVGQGQSEIRVIDKSKLNKQVVNCHKEVGVGHLQYLMRGRP